MNEHLVPAYDGIDLAVRDHGGKGPDVVFVHGVTRTLEDWGPVVQRLRGLRAVAMDLRFHGRSGVPEDASWNDFVRDIEAVVNGLGLSNPFVVGHSFGGVLAMAYAIAHPDCPGVVNIDGFDFRQRELYDELEPSVVDAFLADFRANVTVVPTRGGDDSWQDGRGLGDEPAVAPRRRPEEPFRGGPCMPANIAKRRTPIRRYALAVGSAGGTHGTLMMSGLNLARPSSEVPVRGGRDRVHRSPVFRLKPDDEGSRATSLERFERKRSW